ncbi:hypothetical protein ACS0TY_033097 [Phlomoides rotata]
MRARLTEDGEYEVAKHISERVIREGKAAAIMELTLSGIRPTNSYRYLAHSAGGEDQVGHTMKDHMNFVNREKMKNIEGGDAKTFIELIQK